MGFFMTDNNDSGNGYRLDLNKWRGSISQKVEDINDNFIHLKEEQRSQSESLREEQRQQIEALRQEIKEEFKALKDEIRYQADQTNQACLMHRSTLTKKLDDVSDKQTRAELKDSGDSASSKVKWSILIFFAVLVSNAIMGYIFQKFIFVQKAAEAASKVIN